VSERRHRIEVYPGDVPAVLGVLGLGLLIGLLIPLDLFGDFLMKRAIAAAALIAAAAALSGCAGFTVPGVTGGSAAAANSALSAFLTDPSCSHHDEANFVTGAAGMPASFQAKVERDCPAHPAAPLAAGQSVGSGPIAEPPTP
jgi:hypothetical protein